MLCLFLFVSCGTPAARRGKQVTDDTGTKVQISGVPQRIVSLAPNVTELLYWIGAGERLTGVSRYCNYPAEASRLPRTGGLTDPDTEKITALQPDLVFASYDGNPSLLRQTLAAVDIPLYAVRVDSLSNLRRSALRLGEIFMLKKKVVHKLDQLDKTVQRINGHWRGRRVFVQIGTAPPLYSWGRGTLLDRLLQISGASNCAAAAAGRYPAVTAESVAAAAPHLVVVLGRDNPASRRYWQRIAPAAQLLFVDPDPFSRPGPRMINSFYRLVTADGNN